MSPRRNLVAPKRGCQFVWSDDEVELLINIAADYKALKAAESVDLESVCHTHYITQLFVRMRYQLFSVFSIYM